MIWLDVFSTTPASLGTVVGSTYALIGIGALPSGLLADRFRSKHLIVICLVGMGTGFALVSAAPNMAFLTVALLVWGVSASLYHPAGLALISRGAKKQGTAFAYHGVAGNVGVATGPLLAAVLLVVFDWRTVAVLLLLPVALAITIGLRLEFDETAGSTVRGTGALDADWEKQWNLDEFLNDSRHLFTGGFVLVFAIGILYGLYYRGGAHVPPGYPGGPATVRFGHAVQPLV